MGLSEVMMIAITIYTYRQKERILAILLEITQQSHDLWLVSKDLTLKSWQASKFLLTMTCGWRAAFPLEWLCVSSLRRSGWRITVVPRS